MSYSLAPFLLWRRGKYIELARIKKGVNMKKNEARKRIKNYVLNEPENVRCLVEYKRGNPEVNLYFKNLIKGISISDKTPIPIPLGEELAAFVMESMQSEIDHFLVQTGLEIIMNRFVEGRGKVPLPIEKLDRRHKKDFEAYIDRFVYEIEHMNVRAIKVSYRHEK